MVLSLSFAGVFCEVGAFLRDARLAFRLGVLAELAASDLCNADLLHESFLWVTLEGGHISSRLGGLPLTSDSLVQIRRETVRVIYH